MTSSTHQIRVADRARAVTLTALMTVAVALLGAGPTTAQPYRDPAQPLEVRVQDLLERMTPQEKFWQLFMLAGGLEEGPDRYAHGAFGFQVAVLDEGVDPAAFVDEVQRHFVERTRLGIPVIFFAEALHGLVQRGATVYPQAIGLAATFNPPLLREVAAAIANDCRRAGVRQVLSPVVNIAADVRWGRTEETYGEDPLLSAAMGVAFVRALEDGGVVTTPKHVIANVGDGGRDSYPIHLSERHLREVHLPPFVACIAQGGARSLMTSYNSLDGTPCSADPWLNRTLLKQELGFAGFVISDAGAVGGANVLHMTAADYHQAATFAMRGGLDVIFQTDHDHHTLFQPPFLDGSIPDHVVDEAVARVLRAKFALGLFERPYVGAPAHLTGEVALARRTAREAVVLLDNRGGVLPLGPTVRSLAVLGPDADEARLGGYSGPGIGAVSILDGIVAGVGDGVRVAFARGCARVETTLVTVPTAHLSCPRGPGLLGEYFANTGLVEPAALVRVDPQIEFQWTLFSPAPELLRFDEYSVRWTGTLTAPASGTFKLGVEGNDGYRLYLDGALVLDGWRRVTHGTRLADVRLQAGRRHDLRLEYHEPAGSARLRLVWNVGVPTDTDGNLQQAVDLAATCDAAIVVVGLEEGEFRDRARLSLPGRQEELIRRVADTGTPTVVILVGGSAVTMDAWLGEVDAVMAVWYPGEQGGHAVADVLLGAYNPAGRLPISFPRSEGQLPLVYNHKPTGRGDDYTDLTGRPLFPFGHGLSYTTFHYTDLRIEPARIGVADTAIVRCRITNTGARAGGEVVQLYLRDELASVARPVRELKGFTRIHLEADESREVAFAITPKLLAFLGADLEPTVEPGTTRVMIGASSQDIRLHGVLTVVD